ncbi:MAG: hypothetical protein U9R54_04990 [Bacteroidota bacterium]|nr:hypothetical protein [Bacteroidota bacterium]
MKNLLMILSIVVLFTNTGCTQISKYNKSDNFTVAFYNVENLFDTIDSPNTWDTEFTPEGKKKWNTERYNKKLNDIGKVLSSINKNELPEIVGLCEIENKSVLKDLIRTKTLNKNNYNIIHEDSRDGRGIDVALLYNKKEFKYISHKKIEINFEKDTKYKTRDILYVKGIASKTDTLHIFVNHWKSRSGGQKETEYKRIAIAKVLRENTDKILTNNKDAKIIIMGDLNDEPTNKSVRYVLGASENLNDKENLFNLMYDLDSQGKGTHSYNSKWNMLDNLIVSKALINNTNGYSVKENTGHIFREDFIMFYHAKAGMKIPNRTYGGPNYYGGYSDHLPVYFILNK